MRESGWLESVLGRRVEGWRELVDAIGWSWVLKRVWELADALKPWIGRKDAGEAEREGLARRMLGELALFAHFAEARKGMDDGEWREERAKRLSRAVEALSGGRIRGEYAERLAGLIILYAERRKEKTRKRIENLAEELAGVFKEDAGRVGEEVWGLVDFALNDMHCLAEDCARDEVARKFAAPALELIMLDKAARGGFDGKEALLRFGEMYATAIAGDGTVGPREVVLTVGGELGGGAALLRLATLHLLNDLLPGELKFDVHTYAGESRYYRIAAYGEDAARLMCLLAITAPSAGGGYLSPKFDGFVGEAQVAVRLDEGSIRLTKGGLVAADLVISEGDVDVKYNVYLRHDVLLQFRSTDRGRAELAARLLRLAGVDAEVGRESGKDIWHVRATTDRLAAGRKELRDVLAEIVKEALARGWVDADKAERWLEKLESGRVLKEGWPKYLVRLAEGALEVRYRSTSPEGIEREAQRFRDMGLEEGRHFTVKMPEGRDGYVSILKDGLMRAAWLSIHGSEERQRLAAEFVGYILQRAREAGDDVYKKAEEVVEGGKAVGSLKLTDMKGKEVDVGGGRHVVSVLGGGAQPEGSNSGKTLLRIQITAEVDGVKGDYEMTYGRYGKDNETKGYAYIREEADAERFSALVEVLTGKRPRIRRMRDGRIRIECGREHLEGFARYTELADAVMTWLGETGRR